MMLSNSLSPYKVPVSLPVKCNVISKVNVSFLSFRDVGTLFSGAHVCAKKSTSNKKYICARTSFVCPYLPILIIIYNNIKVSSCFPLVCRSEKTGSQAGTWQGLREKMEVFA